MGNDEGTPAPKQVKAEVDRDDAFQVLVDLGRDLASSAQQIAEKIPHEGVQRAAFKAVVFGEATAHVATKAREVVDDVRTLGEKGKVAVERLEKNGIPVKRWWQNFVDAADVSVAPLPNASIGERAVDLRGDPLPRAPQVPARSVDPDRPRPPSSPPNPKGVEIKLHAVARRPTRHVEDELGVQSPSDPRLAAPAPSAPEDGGDKGTENG